MSAKLAPEHNTRAAVTDNKLIMAAESIQTSPKKQRYDRRG